MVYLVQYMLRIDNTNITSIYKRAAGVETGEGRPLWEPRFELLLERERGGRARTINEMAKIIRHIICVDGSCTGRGVYHHQPPPMNFY